MDLSTARTAVRTRIGVPSSDGFYTDAVLTDLLNEALQALSTENDWPWLLTSESIATVAGTRSYSMAANWNKTKEVFISGYEPMSLTPLDEIDTITYQGLPQLWNHNDGVLILAPIPDTAYTITHRYYKAEAALSGNTDTPTLPTHFHYVWVTKAAHLAYLRAGEQGRADREGQLYQQWLERMNSFKRRATPRPRIRERPGGWL